MYQYWRDMEEKRTLVGKEKDSSGQDIDVVIITTG